MIIKISFYNWIRLFPRIEKERRIHYFLSLFEVLFAILYSELDADLILLIILWHFFLVEFIHWNSLQRYIQVESRVDTLPTIEKTAKNCLGNLLGDFFSILFRFDSRLLYFFLGYISLLFSWRLHRWIKEFNFSFDCA